MLLVYYSYIDLHLGLYMLETILRAKATIWSKGHKKHILPEIPVSHCFAIPWLKGSIKAEPSILYHWTSLRVIHV